MNEIKRDTNKDLMVNVLKLVKENGYYDKAEQIMDYFLPEDRKVVDLSNYRFDFLCKVNFGGSEGIYLDCYVEGDFGENDTENEVKRLSCGTFKTLSEDIDAMKIMGELSGVLTFYARRYVNQNIDTYTPTKELLNRKDKQV